MPPITLDYHVAQGRYGITANTNFNFGTTGLGTCVGVIMTLNNGDNICGHMDHSYEPTQAQRVAFEIAVTAVLNGVIPPGAAVLSVHYSTPGGTRAALYTVNAITAWFAGAVNAGNRQTIYISAGGVQATDANVIIGANAVDNGPFSV
ncbi:hypothetical protein GWC95_12880 [Sediminibacterium roseum]|uniref:Chemotaxis protein CheD n=1 Tax=Sediminibacterium roseum TaxID=1978412 RepID=A0ABX0A0Z4_9BACT|nr:hypothetical protein [Sediminibacterium roseum]NCI50826.1 hypothetical protein [Sediminibacterium roseum]